MRKLEFASRTQQPTQTTLEGKVEFNDERYAEVQTYGIVGAVASNVRQGGYPHQC